MGDMRQYTVQAVTVEAHPDELAEKINQLVGQLMLADPKVTFIVQTAPEFQTHNPAGFALPTWCVCFSGWVMR